MSKLKIQKVATADDRTLPVFAEFDELMDRVRERAYKLFARRGFGDGHELEDWVTAEREVCGPTAELAENDDEFTLKVALAGFEPDDMTVTATPRELIVKAAREQEREEPAQDEGSTVHWTEFRSDDVYRRVELPTDIDVKKVAAKFKRGLLEIKAPKAAGKAAGPKAVEISTAA